MRKLKISGVSGTPELITKLYSLFLGDGGGDYGHRGHWFGSFTKIVYSYWGSGNFIQDIKTGRDMPKDHVVVGKSIVLMHDKKLTAVGIGAGIGHSNSATRVLALKVFIFEFVSGSPTASASGISALDHKALYDAVKDRFVIKFGFGQMVEIIGG